MYEPSALRLLFSVTLSRAVQLRNSPTPTVSNEGIDTVTIPLASEVSPSFLSVSPKRYCPTSLTAGISSCNKLWVLVNA